MDLDRSWSRSRWTILGGHLIGEKYYQRVCVFEGQQYVVID